MTVFLTDCNVFSVSLSFSSMVIFVVMKLTEADVTPSKELTALSIFAAQFAHSIVKRIFLFLILLESSYNFDKIAFMKFKEGEGSIASETTSIMLVVL